MKKIILYLIDCCHRPNFGLHTSEKGCKKLVGNIQNISNKRALTFAKVSINECSHSPTHRGAT